MSFTKGLVFLSTVLHILSGVLGESDYSVTYSSTSICGIKGSFVDIPCTYTYPRNRKITDTFWFIIWNTGTKDSDDMSLDSRYQGRVEYLGDKVGNCTLRLKDLKESDAEVKYRFRFITDDSGGKFSGYEVSLSVTDLRVAISPSSVNQGDRVTLTCNGNCILSTNPIYVWYRKHLSNPQLLGDSQLLSNSHTTSSTLTIASVSQEHAGYYYCAIKGHEAHPSASACLSFWSLTPSPQSICALKGSSVELHSYYTYPCGQTVTKTYWFITWPHGKEADDLMGDGDYQGRINYTKISRDNKNIHTLTIRNLRRGDSQGYRFRLRTDDPNGKMTSSSLHLTVTDLQVQVNPSPVKEGDNVTLTCSATCRLSTNPTYIWYRNSQPLSNSHTADNRLVIDSARPEDAGKYSCAVQGHEIHSSFELILDVRYSPRNISTSVSPSGDIHEGDWVTLTCSSDANPPVQKYTWYRTTGNKTVLQGTGRALNLNHSVDGLYHCEAQNEVGSENSTGVRIFLAGPQNHSSWTLVVTCMSVFILAGLVGVALMSIKRRVEARKAAQPSPADDTYTGLDFTARSPDYDTLDILKTSAEGVEHPTTQVLSDASDYENI